MKRKVQYLGKKKIYEILSAAGYTLPKMKYMEYMFYRGSEWLRIPFDDTFNCFVNYGHIFVSLYECDEFQGKKVEVRREHFYNGQSVFLRVY